MKIHTPTTLHTEHEFLRLGPGFGDVSAWAKGTTNAKRPECGGRAVPSAPVKNMNALRARVTSVPTVLVKHDAGAVIIPPPSKEEGVQVEIRKCVAREKNLDATFAIVDRINRALQPHLFK
jgi:hypothetical protein